MLSNKFSDKALRAFNSIRRDMRSDFDAVIEALEEEEAVLARKNRTCKDEITLRWQQGAQQALLELVEAMQNAGYVLRKELNNEQDRERYAGTRGSAIG